MMKIEQLQTETTLLEQQSKDNKNISIFKAPITNILPLKNVSLSDITSVIKSDKYKHITEKLRSLPTKEERDLFKKKELDYTTLSGVFTKRADNDIVSHSNFFCIDIDHIGDIYAIRAMKQHLLSVFTPALMFRSPSGDGLKIVYNIDISQGSHLQYFTAFQTFFRNEFNTEIDEKCSNVSRACFLCYDPECFYSDAPTVLGAPFIDTFTPTQPKKSAPAVEAITDQSQIIENLKVWINKTQTFTDGNRNKYISELCGAFNRYGINEGMALDNLLQYAEQGFTESEIRATVRSVYNNIALHGIAHFETNTEPNTNPQGISEPEIIERTPLMPINGFPDFIRDLINECTRIYGTHRDLWASAFFAATSGALGQSVMIKTKYENTPLFWLAVVGVSGVGKSEPFNFAFKQLHNIDYLTFEDYNKQLTQYQIDKKDNKGDNKTSPQPEPCKQMIIIDSTPEAMAKALSATPRGITILRDELHGWFNDFGRYSKSGEQQNMLSAWSQQTFKINRANSKNVFIKEPFINIFGGIQPGVIPEMAKDNRAINGFLQRFCFVYPDNIEAPLYKFEEISDELITHYRDYINNLLSIPGYREELRLSCEASRLYADFYNKNATLNNSGKQPDYLNEVNSKLNIIVLRAALLFHLSQWACTGNAASNISETTMKAAIQLTEYFRITAKKVYGIISQTGTDKKEIAKYLSSLGNSQNVIADVLKVTQPYINKILKK